MYPCIILLIGCLGHDEWAVREEATAFLRALCPEALAREALDASDCPETRHRLRSVVRAYVFTRIDSVLGDAPFWPDVDYTPWPYPDTEAGEANQWAMLRRLSTYERYSTGSYADAPAFVAYRKRMRAGLAEYVIRTGDWEYAEDAVAYAWAAEQRSRPSDTGVKYVLLSLLSPDLLRKP